MYNSQNVVSENDSQKLSSTIIPLALFFSIWFVLELKKKNIRLPNEMHTSIHRLYTFP